MALLGSFPVEFGTVFPSVLSGSGDCCAVLHLGLLWLVRHAVFRGMQCMTVDCR
jgi:hypothetical protein